MTSNDRVVVTGGAGFIGSHVCLALVEQGYSVTALDAFVDVLYPTAGRRRTAELLRAAGVEVVETDLRSAHLEPILDGASAIVNEAAVPGLMPSWSRFDDYLSCNVLALQRLLDAARAVEVPKLIHASTSSVYGRSVDGAENTPLDPISPYGVTKLAAENLLQAYERNFGISSVVLRYFSVFGPRQRSDMAFHIFSESILDGKPITVYGDGEQSRTYTYVTDCAAATTAAISMYRPGAVYNIAGAKQVSINKTLGLLGEISGSDLDIRYLDRRPGDQTATSGDWTRARTELGYEPHVDIAEGLEHQFMWHQDLRSPESTA